jgi:pre-mRNA-splicing factor CWC26
MPKLDYLSKYAEKKSSKKKKTKQADLDIPFPAGPLSDNDEQDDDHDGPVLVDSAELVSSAIYETKPATAVIKRERHDSSSSSETDRRKQRKRRHDSSDDDSEPKTRKRYDSSSDDDQAAKTTGLLSQQDFSKQHAKAQDRQRQAAQATADAHGVGETVYRNVKKAQPAKGTDQTSCTEQLQEAPVMAFARHVHDEELEDARKRRVRSDDPMLRHQQQLNNNNSKVYQGPPAKPNRFDILPGYRWDGVDRSNGFEDKLLAKKYSQQYKQVQAYKYSSADL